MMSSPRLDDGLAHPISFTSELGAGLDRAAVLGGGGLYFIAWQVGYLQAAAKAGIDVSGADRVVGTSAGSVVGALLSAGRLGLLHAQVAALGKFPALLKALAPATALRPSQERALGLFRGAADARPQTVQRIGRAALAAVAPEPARMRANLRLIVPGTSWPAPGLRVTCVDAYSGERCVIDGASGVHPARAVAASTAVPGLFSPQPIGDRRCMDGGVSGTGLHLDLVAGVERAFVLSLSDGGEVKQATMTVAPGAIESEIAALRASGSRVFLRTPGPVGIEELMSPEAVPRALSEGAALAEADVDELRGFWS